MVLYKIITVLLLMVMYKIITVSAVNDYVQNNYSIC